MTMFFVQQQLQLDLNPVLSHIALNCRTDIKSCIFPSMMRCNALRTGLYLNTHKFEPEARIQTRLGHHLDLPAVTSMHLAAGKRSSLRSSAHLSNIAGIAVTHILAVAPMT